MATKRARTMNVAPQPPPSPPKRDYWQCIGSDVIYHIYTFLSLEVREVFAGDIPRYTIISPPIYLDKHSHRVLMSMLRPMAPIDPVSGTPRLPINLFDTDNKKQDDGDDKKSTQQKRPIHNWTLSTVITPRLASTLRFHDFIGASGFHITGITLFACQMSNYAIQSVLSWSKYTKDILNLGINTKMLHTACDTVPGHVCLNESVETIKLVMCPPHSVESVKDAYANRTAPLSTSSSCTCKAIVLWFNTLDIHLNNPYQQAFRLWVPKLRVVDAGPFYHHFLDSSREVSRFDLHVDLSVMGKAANTVIKKESTGICLHSLVGRCNEKTYEQVPCHKECYLTMKANHIRKLQVDPVTDRLMVLHVPAPGPMIVCTNHNSTSDFTTFRSSEPLHCGFCGLRSHQYCVGPSSHHSKKPNHYLDCIDLNHPSWFEPTGTARYHMSCWLKYVIKCANEHCNMYVCKYHHRSGYWKNNDAGLCSNCSSSKI